MLHAGFVAPLAVSAVLAWALSWLIPAKPARPHLFRSALLIGLPWPVGHLMLNQLNYFFPPSAGVDWLIFAAMVWLVASGLAALHSPTVNWKRRMVILTLLTLLLAAMVFWLGQHRLAWLFSQGETPEIRRALGWAVAAGGAGFATGHILLARLLPAWGFWLATACLSAALTCVVATQMGPPSLAAIQALPGAIAVGTGLGSLRQGNLFRVLAPSAGWMGISMGLPFLWAGISRSPAASWQLPLLLTLLPLVVFILLKPLAARFHPVGLSLLAAGFLLLGSTALLQFSGMPPEEPAVNLIGDDTGAYD